jgi:DNA-binding NarL/FixJ family response regulator
MLFRKRKRKVKRIMIVEDEPLVAFENEVMLGDAGYEVVATLDNYADAVALLESESVDLVLSDITLAGAEAMSRPAPPRWRSACSTSRTAAGPCARRSTASTATSPARRRTR